MIGAAQRLDISEYRVFLLAHRDWFGEPGLMTVEQAFTAYLTRRVVPVWVRHFVRRTLTESGRPAGTDRTPAARQGIVAGGLVLGAVALVVVLAVTGNPPEGCLFPPCY